MKTMENTGTVNLELERHFIKHSLTETLYEYLLDQEMFRKTLLNWVISDVKKKKEGCCDIQLRHEREESCRSITSDSASLVLY